MRKEERTGTQVGLDRKNNLGMTLEYISTIPLYPPCLAVHTCYVHRNVAMVIFYSMFVLFQECFWLQPFTLIRKVMVVLFIFQNVMCYLQIHINSV